MKIPNQPFATNDTLNPVLWDDDTLKPLVRFKLLSIAKDFIKTLKAPNLNLQDITISGSNAGYGYSKYSDIDLHILVDVADEELEDYYSAKKTIYNIKYNITVKDIPVEVYVQKASQPHYSAGIYSILHNKWRTKPGKETTKVDVDMVNQKAKDYAANIKQALTSNNLEVATTALDDIGRLRKAGLEAGGEQSLENQAFKLIRSKGLVDKLRKYVDQLKTDELSLREMMKIYEILREDEPAAKVVSNDGKVAKLSTGQEVASATLIPDPTHTGQFTMPPTDPSSIHPGAIVTPATTETTEEDAEENDLISPYGNEIIGGPQDGAAAFIDSVVDHRFKPEAERDPRNGRGMSSRALGNRSPVGESFELQRLMANAGRG